MNRKQRAEVVLRLLDSHFPDPPVPLNHEDPFTLCIAVLLSAQTTDKAVNKVTPELFRLANTPFKMALLEAKTIEFLIRTIGLSPTKSRNILALSKILLEKHGGVLPNTLEALETLPGVGHKTAQVVMSQAFGQPAFAVDTHIHRCAERWGLSKGISVLETEKDLKRIFPMEMWSKLHLQIIHYARAYCPARGHSLTDCPICLELGQKGIKNP